MTARTISIASWNINSVRLRMDLVERFVREHNPDVLCLQETKVENGSFPHKPLAAMGFEHRAIHGQKGYHGVAILSRLPLEKAKSESFCGIDDARHLRVMLPFGIELNNFYVPAGGDEPDVKANPKFAHKLSFLDEMERHFSKRRGKSSARIVVVGDLNVAPHENDVWSHKQLLDVVSHTPMETDRMKAVIASHGFVDVTRTHVPLSEKVFTWWSYRNSDWRKSDRGRRLDHVWVSPALAPALVAAPSGHLILSDARDWPRPSDHVPMMVRVNGG